MWLEVGKTEDCTMDAMCKEPGCSLSFLPPATPLLLIHCVHHTILCLPYLQLHPGSLHIASIVQSSVFPTSSHTLTPYTLPPPYYPLLFLPPATSWNLTHCDHHAAPVSPTSNHILAPDILRPSYCPLFLLPPATS